MSRVAVEDWYVNLQPGIPKFWIWTALMSCMFLLRGRKKGHALSCGPYNDIKVENDGARPLNESFKASCISDPTIEPFFENVKIGG